MGNKPSSPEKGDTKPKDRPQAPPLPPTCDLKCQKEKDLALLKKALDKAAETKDTDPDSYEKARIAYFTLLNGQGWLTQEKQKIASQEVQPLLESYRKQYEKLKGEQQSQDMFDKLSKTLKSKANDQTTDFLQKELDKERSKAQALDRMNELNSGTPYSPTPVQQYISIMIDIVIVILIIAGLYFGFTKMDILQGYFSSATESVPELTT